MTYYESFVNGQITIPSALVIHCCDIFGTAEDFLIWLHFLNNKEVAPSGIADMTNQSLDEVNHAITRLQSNHTLNMTLIELDEQVDMLFDVSPAFKKLDQLMSEESFGDSVKHPSSESQIQEVSSAFEAEMGAVSPMQIEELRAWITEEKFDSKLILAALKEASLNRKVSLNYVRAILRRWRQDGVTTARDIEDQKNSLTETKKMDLDFIIPTDGPWNAAK